MKTRGPLVILGLTALLGAATLATPPADAGGCYAPSYGYSYYRPAYYRPAVYHAPAPCYHAPAAVAVHKVKEPPLIVQKEVVIQEVLAPAFTFQVLSAYQTPQAGGYSFARQFQQTRAPAPPQQQTYQTSTRAGGLSDADLDALAARLAVKLGGRQDDPVPRIGGNGAPSQPQQQGNGSGEPTEGERRVIEYMASACVECHQAPNVKAGLTLFDQAGNFAPSSTKKQITPGDLYEAMETTMPPGGRKIDKALLAGIPHWQPQR